MTTAKKSFMRCMAVIDLFIVWFACASVIAFVTTKDMDENNKGCEPEQCEETTEGEETE